MRTCDSAYNCSMRRAADSHKGDNGTVAIVGGSSRWHGAPLFSALAAEASGVDLLHVWVPAVHHELAKATSLNFQVHPFGAAKTDELSPRDTARIVEALATVDAVVIGPGLSRSPSALRTLMSLLSEVPCPMVIDASALQVGTLKAVSGRNAVLTPHLGELERMGVDLKDISRACSEHGCTILLKGKEDVVYNSDGSSKKIEGGNAGLTVGGTGDALAGLTAGLIAQGLGQKEACEQASTVIKRAGDLLFETKGYAYTSRDVIALIPSMLKTF